MNDCIIKWIKKEDLKDAELLLGIPGIGSVANLSADYLIKKMKFELICRIESNYLPNIALITPESTLMLPSFDLYLSKIKSRKIAILKSNYAPVSEHFNYKLADFLAKFLKKLKIKRAFTIAGIAYKEMPKKILIHCATNNALLKKALEKKGLFLMAIRALI